MAIQKWPRAIIQAVAKEKTRPEKVSTSAENPMRTIHRPVGSVTVSTDFLKFPSSIDPPDPVTQL
jgi:hypothetical protein